MINIIFCDDNEEMRKSISKTLNEFINIEKINCKISIFSNYDENFFETLKLKNKIYILDIETPKMSGIRAADTKDRYMKSLSKEERKLIAPESSKEIPVHPQREQILSKMNKFEKGIDKVYNSFRGETDEIFEKSIQKDTQVSDRKQGPELRNGGQFKKEELENSSFSLINSAGKNIDISNLKQNPIMERLTYNRKYDKNNITTYRGTSDNTGLNGAFYGLGLYTTLDKSYASKYGNVEIVDNKLLPNNPLCFKTQNDFQIWEQQLAKELGVKKMNYILMIMVLNSISKN